MLFFNEMFIYDTISRATNAIEGHSGNWHYYLKFIQKEFRVYIILVITLSIFITFIKLKKKIIVEHSYNYIFEFSFLFNLLICILIPLVLFSYAKTKLYWYIYPIFPFLSALFSLCIDMQSKKFFSLCNSNAFKKTTILLVFIFICVAEYGVVKNILRQYKSPSPEQQLLFQAAQQRREVPVYLEAGDLPQGFVLAAKLRGDFIPRHGGRDAWEKEPGAAWLITKEMTLELRQGL
jgi:hypothetical protein